MIGRKLAVLALLLAVGLSGAGVATAQQTEDKPEKDPSKEQTAQSASKEKDKDEETEEEIEKATGPNESITVTATRVESDLMKTPVAVSVFDQETLDREQVRNVRDMAQLVPNMDIATINGQSTPIISLRGIRSTNETELGDPTVGVHLDGVYSPRMQGVLGLMFDNERVEVLRGPQGTLFGRNSTVGNINIISAKPKLDQVAANMSLQYGNFNAPELQGMLNFPVTEKFGLRFAGRYLQRGSYIDGYWDANQYDQRHLEGIVGDPDVIAGGSFEDCTSPECFTRTQHSNWWLEDVDSDPQVQALVPADNDDFYMNAKEWAYRISSLFQPSRKASWNLSFQHFRSDSAGGVDLINCEKLRGRPTYDADGNINGTNDCSDMLPKDDSYQAVVNVPGQLFLDIKYVRSNFTYDINPKLRFVHLFGAEDQDRESAQDMEQALNAWDGAMFFLPGTGSNSWVNEFQLQSFGHRKFSWIVGANYFTETTSTIGYYDNPLNDKSFWVQPDRSTDAAAVFTQGTYALTSKWNLTLGYRYSNETKQDVGGRTYTCNNSNGCTTGEFNREELNELPADYYADPSVYPEFQANDNKGSWGHNDWRVGLDWDVNPNTLLYTYVATGFKAGGIGDVFSEINPRSGEEINARTAYEPEEVTTLEIGFKNKLFNNKLDLRGAYFFSDYRDMQYASVGAIAFTEAWQALRDANGDFIRDDFGNIEFGWVDQPIIAYFTQNVPGAQIQGFELEYDWRPWRTGRIYGYASWLDTEITDEWITKWNYDPVSYFGLSFEDSVDPTTEVLEVNLQGNDLAVAPPFKLRMTIDNAFFLERQGMTIVPWFTAYWEDDSYLTIWNVDQHTDDMEFVIRDEDIRYTDDKREAWSMFHAGVRVHSGDWMAELFAYNITDEVVQYWGGAAEQVAKGSFSMPRTYGIRIGYSF